MNTRSQAGGGRAQRFKRSDCPVACTLDLIGDKWTLLIVRDLFFGRSRYGEFLTAGEGIPTNVLAERLRRLLAAGLIEKTGARPRGAYRLTARGRALGPILRSLEAWGVKFLPGTRRRKRASSSHGGPSPIRPG